MRIIPIAATVAALTVLTVPAYAATIGPPPLAIAAEPAPVPAPNEAPPAPVEAPPTGLKAEEGLTPDATNLIRVVHQKWPNLEIGGVRADSKPYHPSGRALDIMTGGNDCSPIGQEIADWAKANAKELGVEHILWCEQIWNIKRDADGWRPASGHNDHVHITVFGDSRKGTA